MTNDIRILIADDHPIVRRGLVQVIQADPLLKVVAEAGDGESALAQIEAANPRIAILDVDMPKLDGFGVAREIQKRRLPIEIVFLTMHGEEDIFHAAIRACAPSPPGNITSRLRSPLICSIAAAGRSSSNKVSQLSAR